LYSKRQLLLSGISGIKGTTPLLGDITMAELAGVPVRKLQPRLEELSVP